MTFVNAFTAFIVRALVGPFDRPWPALVFTALVLSVALLLLVRWTGNPEAIRRAKDRLIARTLELVLYRHDAVLSFGAGGRILWANFAYLASLALPVAISAVACALLVPQLAGWFAYRPF